MPATAALVNRVAIDLTVPLTPRFIGEIEYNINLAESSMGADILTTIGLWCDKIEAIEQQMLVLSGSVAGSENQPKGSLIKLDVIEWAAIDTSAKGSQMLAYWRNKLAVLLSLQHLLSGIGGNNRIKIIRS